jgi:hypothetical protein
LQNIEATIKNTESAIRKERRREYGLRVKGYKKKFGEKLMNHAVVDLCPKRPIQKTAEQCASQLRRELNRENILRSQTQ